ncbi:MAG: hypothetical protein GC180_02760 [Bacteroidetes bacterium]|nr:hypothetical protein [Bacteroidota bacterium]
MKIIDRFFNLMAFGIEFLFAFKLFLAPVCASLFFAFPLWERNVENDRIYASLTMLVACIIGIVLVALVWKNQNPSTFYGRLLQGFQKGTADDTNTE